MTCKVGWSVDSPLAPAVSCSEAGWIAGASDLPLTLAADEPPVPWLEACLYVPGPLWWILTEASASLILGPSIGNANLLGLNETISRRRCQEKQARSQAPQQCSRLRFPAGAQRSSQLSLPKGRDMPTGRHCAMTVSKPPQGVKSPLVELSNAMSSLHREHWGRGPAAAKSVLVKGLAVCTLTDVFTRAERRLIEAGKGDHVRTTRMMHQTTCEDEYVAAAEGALGQPVLGMVSSPHIDPDLLVAVFILE